MRNNLPSYATTVVLGDGRYELRSARLRSDGVGGLEARYDLAGDLSAANRGIVYAATLSSESALETQIAGYGPPAISVDNLRTIAGAAPSAEAGFNLMNLVINNNERYMDIWLSTAAGLADAGIPDLRIKAQDLLP